ncbi:hypothetical protein [Methylomarinum vadi]|uniref:hypothetical protein n=1 Tax=Methylomarinum vadi TaxID=438855 RepID=UPI0004DF0B72|nr:hypothetical protein [Methylomarinum vadi]
MKTASLTLRVEYRDDDHEGETPQRFFMGDKAIEIEEVIDRWLATEHSYFKVRSGENDIYILRHDELAHRWELTMFQSGKYDDSSAPV